MRDFFEKYGHLIQPEPNSGCWLWLGAATPGRKRIGIGYGSLTRKRARFYAHRCAYEAVHGEGSAGGLMVIHSCDIPLCVNPDHLSLGTNRDNMRDMRERGRSNKGWRNGGHVLSPDQVREILRMRDANIPQYEIGRRFGVSQSAISLIFSGKRWAA